jgi:hypothetical protein
MLRPGLALLAYATAVIGSACGSVTGQPILPADAGAGTLEAGLVAYWKMDETGADDPVVDSSGAENTGTPVNQPQPSTTGAPVRIANGGSRSFDGINQSIDVGNPPALAFAGEVTLAGWVHLSAKPTGCAVIVSHGFRLNNPSAEISLRISGGDCEPEDGPIRWSAGVWDGTNHMADSSVVDSDVGVWIHIAGTFDGRAWHLYKNGTEMSVHVYDRGAFPFDARWGIGGRADATQDYRSVPGRLDEVRIYSRALSPAEILDLYHL